jgi:hypothetical protein
MLTISEQQVYQFNCDDITLVTALLCDEGFVVENVVVDANPSKAPKAWHCTWVIRSPYTQASTELLISYLRRGRTPHGKTRETFTYACEQCGLGWVEDGGRDHECTGHPPDFYTFDNVKRTVIVDQKRVAQEEEAHEQGIDRVFGN